MTDNGAESPTRPRVLLIGDPAARPEGLERALTRAGFQLVEREEAAPDCPADAVLISLKNIDPARLSALLSCPAGLGPAVPRMILTASEDRESLAQALAAGAADALVAPIYLPEVCARLHARIGDRRVIQPANGLEALDCRMRQELERSRRYSLSFSLILLGVDELRAVEEQGGAEAADQMRRDVVGALRRELRLPDFVVTYGPHEFAIILPETGQAGARQSVLRVRDRLSLVPSAGDPRLNRPRFSAGIVTYPHPAVSQVDELLDLAEAALVRGKAQAVERIGVAI